MSYSIEEVRERPDDEDTGRQLHPTTLRSGNCCWIRLSATQPVPVEGATYRLEGRDAAGEYPNVIPMRGISELMQEQAASPRHLTTYAPMETHNYRMGDTSATTVIADETAGVGVRLITSAMPEEWSGPKLMMDFDPDTQTLRILDNQGTPAGDLSSLEIRVEDIVRRPDGWSAADQRVSPFQGPEWTERADELNMIIHGIRDRLLNQ